MHQPNHPQLAPETATATDAGVAVLLQVAYRLVQGGKARHMMQSSVGMNLSGLLPDNSPGRREVPGCHSTWQHTPA